jgi:hypothetical protein
MKKKFLKSTVLLLAGVIGIASVTPAVAADAPAAPPAKPAASPAPAIPKKLSAADLNTELKLIGDYEMMLAKAGYTVKSGKTASGQQALSVSWKNGSWSYLADITLNQIDGENYLSIISPLSNIPDLNKIPVMSVVRLLQAQDATRGWFFVLNTKAKRFYIARLMPATGVRTSLLLSELKVYEENVQGTEAFWNPARWGQPKPASEAPKAPEAPAPSTPPNQ